AGHRRERGGEGLVHLRREDAAEEQGEEERAGRGRGAEASGDHAGAEQDDRADAEEDGRWHRERLGEAPPEREPGRRREHRREHPGHGHGRVTSLPRASAPKYPAIAPPISYGTSAMTSWSPKPISVPRPLPQLRRGQAVKT